MRQTTAVRGFRTIEQRRGVDQPGYQPPVDRASFPGQEDKGFGWTDALGALLVPLWGLWRAIRRFARREVGPGLACLLCAGVGVFGWLLVLPAGAGAQSFGEWGNNEAGDCTFAAAANWEVLRFRHIAATEAQVVAEFHAAGGTDEGGATAQQLFRYWYHRGIAGVRARVRRIRQPARGTIAGLELTPGEVWRVINPAPEEGDEWLVNSGRAREGHMVLVAAIDRTGPIVVSWETVFQVTWHQWRHEHPEVWAVAVS